MAYLPLALMPLNDLVAALGALVSGQPVRPQDLDRALRARFTLLGGARGLANLAVSGIEMAAWDALAVAAGLPLARMLGGAPRPIRAYYSVGMLRPEHVDLAIDPIVAGGYTAMKVKIGWPTLNEDVAIVRELKRRLPQSVAVMVDFNQSLDVAGGLIEEPVRPRQGHIEARDVPGTGITWDATAVARVRVA
jgi:mandelate racemase